MFLSRICEIETIRDELNRMQLFVEELTESDNVIFNTRLVACELVTNVLLHSKCPAVLKVEFTSGKFKITVESECCFKAVTKENIPDINLTSGRGLFIVNNLCEYLERDGIKTIAILK